MQRTITTIVLASLATTALAGPLDPPSGPIDSTMKTLDEVEPRIPIGPDTTPGDDNSTYKITAPGSYYVPRNVSFLSFGSPKHAIEVASNNVTIDFCGFSYITLGDSTLNGVTSDGLRLENITVKNGTLIGFDIGVVFNSTDSENIVIEDMRILDSDFIGINVYEARISDCVVKHTAGTGISITRNGMVDHCTIEDNYTGIFAGTNTIVHDTNVRDNLEDGITVSSNCIIRNNVVTENGIGSGIKAGIQVTGSGSLIDSNVVNNNEFGLRSSTASVFVRNIVTSNVIDIDISPVNPGLGDESSSPSGAGAWDNIVLP